MGEVPDVEVLSPRYPEESFCASLERVRRALFSNAPIVRLLGAAGTVIPMIPQLIVPTHCMVGLYVWCVEMVPPGVKTANGRVTTA